MTDDTTHATHQQCPTTAAGWLCYCPSSTPSGQSPLQSYQHCQGAITISHMWISDRDIGTLGRGWGLHKGRISEEVGHS